MDNGQIKSIPRKCKDSRNYFHRECAAEGRTLSLGEVIIRVALPVVRVGPGCPVLERGLCTPCRWVWPSASNRGKDGNKILKEGCQGKEIWSNVEKLFSRSHHAERLKMVLQLEG